MSSMSVYEDDMYPFLQRSLGMYWDSDSTDGALLAGVEHFQM
jgi:hypothetical protein